VVNAFSAVSFHKYSYWKLLFMNASATILWLATAALDVCHNEKGYLFDEKSYLS
jgi:hypothetical protein